jgi:peptidoglycan/LPS O-acetylase OafA/YrhL
MGLLRFILAMSVVYAHVDSPFDQIRGVGGATAVESFFVISGFLISKILSSKKYSRNRDFYLSRALRIYPTYFIAVTISVIYFIALNSWGNRVFEFSSTTIIPNALILFQDLVFMIDDLFDYSFGNTLLLGVSWTLAVELYFYALAPIFLRFKTNYLLFLSLGLISIKLTLFLTTGLDSFFSYRFAPLEFGFFLLGFALQRIKVKKYISLFCFVLVIASPYLIPIYLIGNIYDAHAWYSVIFPILVAFSLSASLKFDEKFVFIKYLGALSFPIYLYHTIISEITISAVSLSGKNVDPRITGLVIVFLTIIFSAFSYYFVERYFNRLRHLKTNSKI